MYSVLELTDFQQLFTGNPNAYGVHKYSKSKSNDGKEQGESYTKKKPVSEEHYANHLKGKQGLGIIPIMPDSKVLFAVIDVDTYTNDVLVIVEAIYKNGLPLVPFRSKSGGLHLYLFFETPLKASEAKRYLRALCLLLGLDTKTEIFPKQDKVKKDQIGNWINLPYFKEEKTSQYLIKSDNTGYTLSEAIEHIKDRRCNIQILNDVIESLPLQDAPPCLQAIATNGETDYRNEYLFNMARYLKTKYGDDFEFKIAEANNDLNRPLAIDELAKTVIAAHKKKDYSYRCDQEPIVSLCNKSECRLRKYGIGGVEVSALSYEDFIQYDTDPPYYEWVINSKSLKFYSEQDIIRQEKFRELCFRALHILPVKLKEINWTIIVNNALTNVIVKKIGDGEDISPGAMFKEHLIEFLERRAMAANKTQVLVNRVYKDDELQMYIFKAKQLLVFLIQQKQFRYYGQTEIQDRLRQMGGAPKRYYIDRKTGTTRVWTLPYTAIEKFVEEEPNREEYIIDFKQEFTDEAF